MATRIHWTEMKWQVYTTKLHPLMLFHTCFEKFTQLSTRTHSSRSGIPNEKESYTVIYDRAYVIRKIIYDLIEPLKYTEVKLYQNLIQEAFETHQKEQGNGDTTTIQKGR